MISVALVGADKTERQQIRTVLREFAAKLTDEHWQIDDYMTVAEFVGKLNGHPAIDIGCMDFCTIGMTDAVREFRKSYGESMLLLIADTSISPTAYLKPGIRADSLLLRPLTDAQLRSVIQELVSSYLVRTDSNGEGAVFVLKEAEETWRIPYDQIFYFESREKKIFARTLQDEYGFYGTLERIEEVLPEGFARSHRSFIVNVAKLKNVFLSQNNLQLAEGFVVPLSRTYKQKFKELRKQIQETRR